MTSRITASGMAGGRTGSGDDAWSNYAELTRRLEAVRSQESARTAGVRQGAAEMTRHADELEARLRGQGGMLSDLADDLQVRRPKLTAIPPEGSVEPAPALSRVAAAIDRTDAEVRTAVERGRRPELLPGLGAGPRAEGTRAALVYGVFAFVVLVVQFLSIRHGGHPSYLRVLFIVPLVGFLLGYTVLNLGGKARLGAPGSSTPVKSPVKSGPRRKGKNGTPAPLGPTRPRLGFVLCFGIGPVLLVIDVLVHVAGPASR